MPKAVFKLSLLSTALLLASQNLWAEELEAIDVVDRYPKLARWIIYRLEQRKY